MQFSKKTQILALSANFSAFLFLSFFLSVKGMHSWAMAVTLLTAMGSLFFLKDIPRYKETKVLVIFLLCLALFWSHSFDGWFTWSTEGDFFIKYSLGALCAWTVASIGISPRALALSLALGSISSGGLAIYQFPLLGRSEGFTNAIKFGDIAIYMGIACWILAVARNWSCAERAALVLAGGMGLCASLLSLSRGGWVVLVCLPLLAMYVAPRNHRGRWFAGLCLAIAVLGAGGSQVPALQHRMTQAEQEITGYLENSDKYVSTSIGARMEQWRLSWALGASKPLTGWGEHGYYQAKEALIAQGKFHPFLREIHHSHNDFLDMWAKRGMLGVMALLLIYMVPMWIFYPTRQRVNEIAQCTQQVFIVTSLVGFMLPVCYFIFGWTDVFFNLTIGHNYFIFSLVFILGALNWMRRHQAAAPSSPDAAHAAYR